MTRLIHITPELPPTVGGVADYTSILTRRMVEVSDEAIEPVLVHAGRCAVDNIDVDFPVENLSGRCSASGLAVSVNRLTPAIEKRAVVLLEYSGYGYAKRGAPCWLTRGLQRACGEDGVPLVTVFHEISASGPIWRSAFWLSPVQTFLAGQIGQRSKGLIVAHPSGAEELEQRIGEDTSIQVCPVFSNVGEPNERPSYSDRSSLAVIFGGNRTKTALYERNRGATQAVLDRWAIDTVVDVGPPDASEPAALKQPVNIYGVQPMDTVSSLLLDAQLGLLHYPAEVATKSGVLAAYMAHGVVPVLVAAEPLGGVLEEGRHFVKGTGSEERNDPDEIGHRISRAVAAWYDNHAHSRLAAQTSLNLIKRALEGAPVSPSSPM